MKTNQSRAISFSVFGLLVGLIMTTQAQLVDGQTIGVDFGPTGPTNNFNQRNNSGTTTEIIDMTGAPVSNVTVDLIGATFSNNDADDDIGIAPVAYDSSNLTDWVGAVNSNEGMTITIAGLDDALTYNLNIGHAFDGNVLTNGTMYTAGTQTVTNVDASVDPNFFNLNELSTDGAGNLVITVTLPIVEGGAAEVPTVSGLTLTAVNSSSNLVVSIENSFPTNELIFTWSSRAGRVYDLLSNTDLSTAPSSWNVLQGGISADSSRTNMLTIPRPSEAKIFFAIEERIAP